MGRDAGERGAPAQNRLIRTAGPRRPARRSVGRRGAPKRPGLAAAVTRFRRDADYHRIAHGPADPHAGPVAAQL
jgi:hypothetical protein